MQELTCRPLFTQVYNKNQTPPRRTGVGSLYTNNIWCFILTYRTNHQPQSKANTYSQIIHLLRISYSVDKYNRQKTHHCLLNALKHLTTFMKSEYRTCLSHHRKSYNINSKMSSLQLNTISPVTGQEIRTASPLALLPMFVNVR